MDAISAHRLQNLKTQLEQELHTLLTEKFIHDPYNQAYLRDFINQKVQEFEHKNYQNMLDYSFDVRIDESAIEYGRVIVDVNLYPSGSVANINPNFSVNPDTTIQDRNEKRGIMKKKIKKVKNA